MRSLIPSVAAACAALLLSACNDLDVCGSTIEDVTRADGTVYRCTQSEECPRASREFVCTTDITPESDCISCVDTRCVRVVPEACE